MQSIQTLNALSHTIANFPIIYVCGCLGPGHTTAKTTTTVTVTFMATAINAVNRSHTKLSFRHNGVQFVANFLLIVYFRPVQLRDVRV